MASRIVTDRQWRHSTSLHVNALPAVAAAATVRAFMRDLSTFSCHVSQTIGQFTDLAYVPFVRKSYFLTVAPHSQISHETVYMYILHEGRRRYDSGH